MASAYDVPIAGSPCTAKVRNPWVVLGLTLITLGIYSLFWWYFINREMRDLGHAYAVEGLGERPGLSTAAYSPLSVFTLYIALLWTIVTTTRRVRHAQRVAGVDDELNYWLSGALWIFTLELGGIVYTQAELNKVWRAQEAEAAELPPVELEIEDPEDWPAEHPALWDRLTRPAYKDRYGKVPGV